MEKITADTVLNWAREQVESKNMPSREVWLDIAFRLNLLKIEEAQLLNKMRQSVAKKKFEIMTGQAKRNVSAADLEVEITDEYRFVVNNWDISKKGVISNNKIAKNKKDLQENYRRNVNQIVSNDSKTNFTWVTPTGEIIEFVGIGNHLEKEI